MNQIHIVGVSPRTGTTLMAEAIKTCFKIDYCTSHEDRLFSRPPFATHVFVTKSPRDIMIVGPSLKVDPDFYVICMIRDPRDIIISKHQKNPERYWAGLKFWNVYSKMVEKLRDHPRFITIKYEYFVNHPDEVQNLVMEKIPFLKKKARFSEFHLKASVSELSRQALSNVRPIKSTSIGKWRQLKPRIKGQIELHGSITEDLIHFGYEKDHEWEKQLNGIEPDLSESHHSEYMTFKDRLFLKTGKYLEAMRRILEQFIDRRIRIIHPKKWF